MSAAAVEEIPLPQTAAKDPRLHRALEWWRQRDDMGGFRTAAAGLFPSWLCRPGCCMAPHRQDRLPHFSMRSNNARVWFFKDRVTDEIGGLTSFVMLAGMDAAMAAQWLIERAPENDEARMTKPESMTNDETQIIPPMNTHVSYPTTPHVNGVATRNGSNVGEAVSFPTQYMNSTQSPTPPDGKLTASPAIPAHAATDDYPHPMPDAAYHGIAGEIVRLIEPHTEADPAALLFQLLAAYGNLIGRDAHMVADGARHGLNLFGVLVGQSSKGRKGTSWNQVAALLERIDEDWKAKRVTSGLSSGEGLIACVRDPATVSRADDDKPGETRQVTTDDGEPDKRLMVVEGEFANTLKVMERETNTLSPVIRAAWDSGSLRTLTKNTPLKATGAHISIIGHITRDELRRHLDGTEAANGFANRFCWLAVRRSKCLPEGGRIDTVNFNSALMRLKSAIDFARAAGELKRDEAARDLWRGIYPMLSEGRPGLLGAVTGRAEAQVMRLSALYALLDCSAVITPQHHYAAMAMWSYCEQSARWIFGTATGDKNADKILAALRQAGREGMTRSEISEKVFQKHLTSSALDDALRILEVAGVATCAYIRTTSNGSERWVAAC